MCDSSWDAKCGMDDDALSKNCPDQYKDIKDEQVGQDCVS